MPEKIQIRTLPNSRSLSVSYDNRLRPSQWNIPGVMGWNYAYTYFGENTGRVTYAQNINDATLDRSYDYDNVGRLVEAHTGSEARGALIGQGGAQDGPYAHSYRYDQMGNMWYRVGWGGWFNPWLEQWPSYTNNRLTTNPWTSAAMQYDASGNLTNDGYQSYSYDATGQQTYASATALSQSYDGDRLRVKKTDSGVTTYYLRSTVLGGQVISELNGSGTFQRGYVYGAGQMLAIQQSNQVSWVHQDPVTKSQRITNGSGTVTSTVDLDPWGGETVRSNNQAFQPHRYTTYERDGNSGDDAMMRRYTGKWHRFDQPDPSDGSYDMSDPQSFNRYSYVSNDPVNSVDPSGLLPCTFDFDGHWCIGDGGRPIDTNPYLRYADYLDPGTIPSPFGGSTAGGRNTGGAPQGPQKSQPELVPCTFNINISGASGETLTDAQNELTRIFGSGGMGLNVVFNQLGQANGGSTNLSIVQAFSGEAAAAIVRQGGGSPSNVGILGVTPTVGNSSYVNQSHISSVTAGLVGSGANMGTMIGRIGAHEVIQHRLFGVPQEGTSLHPDITSSRVTAQELRAVATTRFNLNPLNAATLSDRCRRCAQQERIRIAMKHLILLLCLGWLFSLSAPDSYACSCVIPEVPQAFREAQAVFVGEVTGIVEPHSDDRKAPAADRLYTITFRVERSWKGVRSQEMSVLSDQGRAGCFSWGPFLKGKKYLVYAERRTPAGAAIRNLAVLFSCNRTALLPSASEDLKTLETVSLKPRASGRRNHHSTNGSRWKSFGTD